MEAGGEETPKDFSGVPALCLPGKHLDLELKDSYPRALAYVAGAVPKAWEFLTDGSAVAKRAGDVDKRPSNYDKRRQAHPLFTNAALLLVLEIDNRQLFSNVGGRKQLTYDANCSLTDL